MAITKYEEILHLCPELRSLVVVLIGPAFGDEHKREHIPSEEILCDTCCERGRRFTVVCCGGLYHDAVPTLPHYRNGNPIPPTAAVILNSDIDLAFKSNSDSSSGGGGSGDGLTLTDTVTPQAAAAAAEA